MSIPTQLGVQPGVVANGQVRSLINAAPRKKREGRGQHPLVSDGNKSATVMRFAIPAEGWGLDGVHGESNSESDERGASPTCGRVPDHVVLGPIVHVQTHLPQTRKHARFCASTVRQGSEIATARRSRGSSGLRFPLPPSWTRASEITIPTTNTSAVEEPNVPGN
jgi:hypothetical protein